jgi:heat shock protein HslJ
MPHPGETRIDRIMRRVLALTSALFLVMTLLVACGSSNPLTANAWRLTRITQQNPAYQGVVPPADAGRYTVAFKDDGTFSGQADCNAFAGTYETSGSNGITIAPGPMTLAACADGEFGLLYVHALATASSYEASADTLTLTLTDGGTLGFASGAEAAAGATAPAPSPAASAPADLVGRTWQLTAVTEQAPAFQGVVPPADAGKYTIQFMPDGTFSAQADCNMVSGGYAAGADGSLSITPGPSTLMACPPGSMGDLYVVGLADAASYAIDGGTLTITLKAGGTLQFE